MIDLLKLIFSVLIPLFAGFVLLKAISRNSNLSLLMSLSLAPGLGYGLIALVMFFLGILSIPIDFWSIISVITVITALSIWKFYRERSTEPVIKPAAPHKIDLLSLTMLLIIVIYIVYVFWSALHIPVICWDELATIAFKGKVIFFDRSLDNFSRYPHTAYPLFVPFITDWTALNLGYWDNRLIKIVLPVFFTSFLMFIYALLKNFTTRRWSLAGCILLISSPLFVFYGTIIYRELFLLYYFCISVLLLLLWKENDKSIILLSGLFAGMASFTKVEGGLYLIILTPLILFKLLKTKTIKKYKDQLLRFVVPSFGLWIGFQVFRIALKVSMEEKTKLYFGSEYWDRFLAFIHKLYLELFFTGNWNILFIFFMFGLIHRKQSNYKSEIYFLNTMCALLFSLIAALAIFTSSFKWIAGEQWFTTLPRLVLHFFPLVVISIILTFCPAKDPIKNDR
jgi:hypothetical protein